MANVDQMRVRADMPFFWGIIVFLLVAIAIPGIATWPPELMHD